MSSIKKRMGSMKELRRADVAARDGRDGSPVWIVYKDSVYDVTGYVKEHPGGDVLLEEAGQDATKAFEDIGHSADARAIMAKFKIGEIIEEERRYDAHGKKRKVAAPADDSEDRSCLSLCTCGLLG